MAASELPPPNLPAAGTSPFHARGSRFTGMQKHAKERVAGGLDAVCRHLPDDAHRAFVKQTFLPVGWYDAIPLYAFARAIADAEGRSAEEFLRVRTIEAAQTDMNGLYKLILRVASPELVADRLQRATSRYFDFGKAEVLEASRGRSVGSFSGIPRPVGLWCAAVIPGYATEVLKVAGARMPRCHVDPLEHAGSRETVELVTLRLHLAWS